MIVTLWICFAALVIGMGLVLIRLEIGPTNLDRAVALDVITASAVGIVVVLMALTAMGRSIEMIPLPVVEGFTFGIGIIILQPLELFAHEAGHVRIDPVQADDVGEDPQIPAQIESQGAPQQMAESKLPPVGGNGSAEDRHTPQ